MDIDCPGQYQDFPWHTVAVKREAAWGDGVVLFQEHIAREYLKVALISLKKNHYSRLDCPEQYRCSYPHKGLRFLQSRNEIGLQPSTTDRFLSGKTHLPGGFWVMNPTSHDLPVRLGIHTVPKLDRGSHLSWGFVVGDRWIVEANF